MLEQIEPEIPEEPEQIVPEEPDLPESLEQEAVPSVPEPTPTETSAPAPKKRGSLLPNWEREDTDAACLGCAVPLSKGVGAP